MQKARVIWGGDVVDTFYVCWGGQNEREKTGSSFRTFLLGGTKGSNSVAKQGICRSITVMGKIFMKDWITYHQERLII